MLEYTPMRRWMLYAVIALGIIFAIPSLLPKHILDQAPRWMPKATISLGLDLAGGSHLLYEADASQLAKDRLEKLEDEVVNVMRRAEPRIKVSDMSRAGGKLSFLVDDVSQVDAARRALEPLTAGAGTGRDWNILVSDGNRISLDAVTSGDKVALKQAMESAKQVIETRINKLGTLEPTIILQGENRVVVQVPGVSNPEEIKKLVGETAKLEFKLVDDQADPDDVKAGKSRVGSQILPYTEGGGFIAVRRLGGISGDKLVSAKASFSQENNEPVVDIKFDTEGGAKFARMTQQYTGKLFAIILDGQVISAPRINEPILGGSSQISGSFTTESANQLAIKLASGALPVDLKVVEERSVGPDLGADSIRRGALAGLIGTTAILVLMIVTYGRFGVYADLALIINIAMILAVMAVFGATLTLPGIAGFVLTIGAAVDANVLINERIREESKRGRRVAQAVENGYKEASRAIFDANITNVIAAVLLFQFGSGPIKGFAVVLTIGIVTSVFTAVVITRMWVAGWLKSSRPTELVI
jgi:preprotein translocase subunit SecD